MQLEQSALDAVESMVEEVTLAAPPGTRPSAIVAGIGTTAERALAGSLLADAFTAAGVRPDGRAAFEDPDALLAAPDWALALVLSPWKIELAARLPVTTTSAAGIGAVDTLLRTADGIVGVNTNTWAAQAAMQTLVRGADPERVVILGSGGSARSVAAAVRRAWPRTELLGSARNAEALASWAEVFGARPVAPGELTDRLGGEPATLVVNTTTWGETAESERTPFAFPLPDLLAPGRYFFDLNNRVSSLPTEALGAGMSVMSGTLMQRVTNACRARLLRELTR